MQTDLNKCRILVFSVPSWNDKIGANSWATFLSNFNPENIACVCLREDPPNNKTCSRYFLFSENRIIKSILNRKIITSYEFNPHYGDECNRDITKHNDRYSKYHNRKKRNYMMLMARELIWKVGKWKSREFNQFLDEFQPDLILHSMDGYIHMNRIVLYAMKRTGAKAIGYIWDDNFSYKVASSLGFYLYRFFQRKSLRKLAERTASFFAISDTTKQEADDFFGINATVITKPLNDIPVYMSRNVEFPIKMVYTGSLIIGRDDTLISIIKAMEKINKNACFFQLDVYTNTQLSEEKRKAMCKPFCTLHDAVPQEMVITIQKESDALLFLEALSGEFLNSSRLSFSTKITDYLSSGRPIIAIGHDECAPIRYFLNNDAAMVCTSEQQITDSLYKIVKNKNILNEYALKSCECGITNHHPDVIQKTFDSVVSRTLE